MKRSLARGIGIAVALLLGGAGLIGAQEIGVREVKDKTLAAAEFLSEAGEEGLAAIGDLEGEWAREPYVFVYNLQGAIIGHPNPRLIGKNFMGVKDVKGKMFPAEFVLVARSEIGRGWVDYWWPRLSGGQPEQKVSYIARVPGRDMLVGAGIYGFDKAAALEAAGD